MGSFCSTLKATTLRPRPAGQLPAVGPVHLIRRDRQTNDEKELYRAETRFGVPNFLTASPDGRNLSFAYIRPGETENTNWILPLSGGEPRELHLLEGSRGFPSWTQDGKAVLFARSDEIWVQPVDGGPAYGTGIRIEGLIYPSVHPDGSRIAFVGRKTSSAVWKLQNLFPVPSATK
jgi:Tol biopolymer transport system component